MYIKKENYIQHDSNELGTTIKGAINELEVCAWLMKQGYEVFRNVAPTGKGDIIIWKSGEDPIVIDVKTGSKSKHYQVKTILAKNGNFEWLD